MCKPSSCFHCLNFFVPLVTSAHIDVLPVEEESGLKSHDIGQYEEHLNFKTLKHCMFCISRLQQWGNCKNGGIAPTLVIKALPATVKIHQ